MSGIEDKNRETKIRQQKNTFIRNIIICLTVVLVFSLFFWLLNRSAGGTEISYNEFRTQLSNGNIKEINLNESKIQIYYLNDEAHWLYARDSAEAEIQALVNELFDAKKSGVYEGDIPKLTYGTTSTISIFSIIYPIIMIVLFVIMLMLILKQFKGANNKSFDFVKSRARIYPSKTKFSDVAGEDEEKAELEDVVDFLKNPKKYIELGAKIPKGVLLVGPPGTGKTLLARAVAGEAGVPFFTISGSDFMELFVGVGASRVRDLFENAKKAKPCIIFIDEIDAVGRQRGAGLGGGNDEREQTLNQLLVQMDGFEDNEGIIVMAATNRVDILDPALLRPGRFDRRVNINIPDIKGREEILKVHAKNKPLRSDVDLKTIARITSGFTGAEIENLLNEAAILTAKENRKEITEEDIQKSIMKVTLGPQKRSRVVSEADKRDTAIHESGHALISKLAKEKTPVHEVSIIPRGGAGGYTLSSEEDYTVYFKEKLICKIQMLLGGITAEKLYVGDISTGASNDLKRATNIARRMVTEWGMSDEIGMVYCGNEGEVFVGKSYQERMIYSDTQAALIDKEVKKLIDSCQKETEKLLVKHKDKLMVMADVLIEKETIYSEEVDLILEGKTKEEILQYIEAKDKKSNEDKNKTENSAENNEKTTENIEKIEEKDKKTAENINEFLKSVDELIKIAEERENQAKAQGPVETTETTPVVETKEDSQGTKDPVAEAKTEEVNKEVQEVVKPKRTYKKRTTTEKTSQEKPKTTKKSTKKTTKKEDKSVEE